MEKHEEVSKTHKNTELINNVPNTSSNNKLKPYNKKELMKLTKQERMQAVFGDMQKQLDLANQDPDKPKVHNFKQYLYNTDNKAFHLEIIKRTFKRQ